LQCKILESLQRTTRITILPTCQHIDILTELQAVYFEQGEYLKAFRIKKTQRAIEDQYGFRALSGASQLQQQRQAVNPSSPSAQNQAAIAAEMTTPARKISKLLERISLDDHKLTIIHGPMVGTAKVL